MANFGILLKTLLLQKKRLEKYNSAGKKNRYVLVYVILGISILPLLALVVIAMYNVGIVMKASNIVTEGYTYLITGMQAIVLFTGVISMLSVIYFSKDTEFLLPLPISSSTIYAAKLTVVYIEEVITSVIMSLVVLVPYGIGVGAGAGAYFQMLLVVLIAPMLPLLVGAIIAIPLMWFIGFFKNKGVTASIIYIVLFGLLYGLYFYFIYNFSAGMAGTDDGQIGEIITKLILSMSSGARAILPNFLLATTLNPATLGEYLLSFLLALLINAVLLALAVLISSFVYRQTVSRQLENPKTAIRVRSTEKRTGIVGTFIKTDLRRIMRDTGMGTYTLMQLVIVPIVIVFMLSSFLNTDDPESNVAMAALAPMIITALCSFMGLSTNYAATSAFTRENKSFYVYKMLPVDFKRIMKSKIIIGVLFNEVTILFTVLACVIFGSINWYYVVAIFLVTTFLGVGTVCWQVYIDLMKPRLNWNTFAEGAKNNPSSLFSLLLGFVFFVVIAAVGVPFMLPVFQGNQPAAWAIPVMWTILLAISAAYMIISYAITIANCQKLFDRIES